MMIMIWYDDLYIPFPVCFCWEVISIALLFDIVLAYLLEKSVLWALLINSRWRGLALKRRTDCMREAVIKRSKGPLKDKFSNKPLTSFILLVSWRKERKNKKKRRRRCLPLNTWIVLFWLPQIVYFLREQFVFGVPFKFLNIALNPPSRPFITRYTVIQFS